MDLIKPFLHISNNLFFIAAGLLGVAFLIGFHEIGHFIFCKIFDIRTPSFSIGFGPRVFAKKIGETEFSLSAIPFGGYVEMAGSAEIGQGEQKESSATDERSFAAKPYYQKLLVMLGGIIFNLLFAYVAFILMFATGLPKNEFLYPKNASTVIQAVRPDSAAAQAGLVAGDTILAINATNLDRSAEKAYEILKPLANQTVSITFERNGQPQELSVTLGQRTIFNKPVGDLGIQFETIDIPPLSFSQAVKNGIATTNSFIYLMVRSFKHIITNKDTSQMGGPIKIISETAKGAQRGFKIFLIFLAVISINLAVLNLIPLPILDGGQILFYTIEAIIRRPISENVRYYIHLTTWVAMLALIVYFSIKDIWALFSSCK